MICLNLVLSAQDYSFKVDSLIDCEEIIVKDTIFFPYSDSSNNQLFPINSEVKFQSDIGDFILHTATAKVKSDTTFIYFTKQSYGLVIDVKLTMIDDKIETQITYWSVIGEAMNLTNSNTILTLQQNDNQSIERLIGNIEIDFSEKVLEENSMELIKVTGKINGCFNVPIEK